MQRYSTLQGSMRPDSRGAYVLLEEVEDNSGPREQMATAFMAALLSTGKFYPDSTYAALAVKAADALLLALGKK